MSSPGTAGKGAAADYRDFVVQGHRFQTRASGESQRTYLGDVLRGDEGFQTFAFPKHGLGYFGYSGRYIYRAQAAAKGKSRMSDGCHAVGDFDLFQTAAEFKSPWADGSCSVRYVYAFQRLAAGEGLLLNDRNFIG